MRPIIRGEAPRVFKKYGEAISDLEKQFGKYCSYCEEKLNVGLEVEHVSPKDLDQDRELDWENFLLACKICNTIKGKKPTNDDEFLWPDKDNTLRAIEYGDGGLVSVSQGLSDDLREKAESLINLIGLDRHPGQPSEKQPSKRDERFSDREEVWSLARLNRGALSRNDSEDLREAVAELAKASGFFGVWMSVFCDDADMRKRIVGRYDKGTMLECFDENWKLVSRPGGRV